MELWHAIVLGIVQGLTEFLPVSSSGHLVIVRELLPGIDPAKGSTTAVMFAVAVHVGTLLSVLIYFHKRLIDLLIGMFKKPLSEQHRTVLLLIVATIPAGIAGFTLKSHFERAFESPFFTSFMLIVTGALLVLPRFFAKPTSRADGDVTLAGAIVMGIGQAFAILPGISRSGSTIASGMLAGVNLAKLRNSLFSWRSPQSRAARSKSFSTWT